MSLLALDARWRRFNDPARKCPCCGQSFSGVFDIGFDHPDGWPHAPRDDQPFVKSGEDQLAPDLCRHGDHRLIRAVLTLPLQGSDDAVHLSLWVRLDPADFYAYLESWDTGDETPLPDCPGVLDTTVPGLSPATPTACMLTFPAKGQRPTITANDGPLREAQTLGISFDHLLDLYAACDQDIRPHLMRD
ncbi:DUF2199 domain-containing protein [Thalassovita taeanensis]|uniref:DUF2199 domain-containing protein n=1 Tax=Thalassovita taeanensis TaxID=657014 RepID=A0A1H9FSJ8_9RHOB|nr:DUF2199 domain-containing protein [Thalassovita taeanensis]SEQ40854.1 hypothetical protein SAMN04488092_106198 [Thalassovita taeanensis]